MEFKIKKTEEEWKKSLSEEQYEVMRKGETELPFTGEYLRIKGEGIFRCVGCDRELFDMKSKFDLGSGWPSFSSPIDADAVIIKSNSADPAERSDVACAGCGSHLGHLFEDGGPREGLDRYCINSCVLKFEGTIIEEKVEPPRTKTVKSKKKKIIRPATKKQKRKKFRGRK